MQRPLLVPAGLLLLAAWVTSVRPPARASSGGAVPGHTGAPAVGGRDCTACHAGRTNSGPGAVRIHTPTTTFFPGQVIPMEVELAIFRNPYKNGYQMAAYKGNRPTDILSGWVTPDPNVSRVVADHIGHAAGGNTRFRWRMYFQVPATLTVPFTFYAAGNDANNDGLNTGDLIYTTARSMQPGLVPLALLAVPRPGVTVPLRLASPGDAGKPYILGASLSDRGLLLGGKRIPLALDGLLLIVLQNLLPTVFQNYAGVLDASGRATAYLALPPLTALKGAVLYHAFVVLDPRRPGGVGTVSNGLPVAVF